MNLTSEIAANISNFHTIDYTVLGILLTLSVSIGIYFGFFDGTEQTTDEYLLGGRRMRPIPVAISLVASQLSAYSIVAVPAEIYSFGSHYMMISVPATVAMTVIMNYGILPVFYNNKIENCYAYLELRFGKTVRSFTTHLCVLAVMLFLPIASFLPAFAFSRITGLNLHMINAIVSVICITYTMMGGVKAVIWTDVVQAFVMVSAIFTVLVCAVIRVGGVAEVMERTITGQRLTVPPFVLDMTTRQTVWNLSTGLLFVWLASCAFNQNCVQRLSTLSSMKDVRKAMVIFCTGFIIIKVTTSAIGLAMYAFYAGCDPVLSGLVTKADEIMPIFVNEIIGHMPGMPGVFISCVFSASLSTVSAYLNSTSGIIYQDYICRIKSFRHTERKATILMRLIIVAIGVYCIAMGFLVEKSKSLFQLQFTLTSLTVGVSVGVYTLALFYPRASQKATLCGAITSIALMTVLLVSAQLYPNVYKPLPTSIDGCASNVTAHQSHLLQKSVAHSTDSVEFAVHNISFQWYPFIGTLIVWLVAVVLSHTIFPLKAQVDPALLSPLVRRFVSKSLHHQHTEMQAIGVGQTLASAENEKCSATTETIYAVRQN